MPTKDGVDLRKCVDLLTHMLEQDKVGESGTARRGGAKAKRAIHGKKQFLTTGRLSRHETSSKTISYSRGRRGGGRLVRASCGSRQRPVRNSGLLNEDLGADNEEFMSENRVVHNSQQSSMKKPDQKNDDARAVITHSSLEPPSMSTLPYAQPVLFNQRLLSSTPLDTPVKKTLVERNGVLYLNGSTDTQILNATDEALALRPPGPARPPGPILASGHVQFVPNPRQYQRSPRELVPPMLVTPEINKAAISSSLTKAKTVHDDYSLYSSTDSSVQHNGHGIGDYQPMSHSNVNPLLQSFPPPQSRALSNHLSTGMNYPFGGYSSSQYIPNSNSGGQLKFDAAAISDRNPIRSPQKTVDNQHVPSLSQFHKGTSNSYPFGMLASSGNENVVLNTPAVNTGFDYLLSSGGVPDTSNTVTTQDFNVLTAVSYPGGVSTSRSMGNTIDTVTRTNTQLVTAPVHHTRHADLNARTYLKQTPVRKADVLSGRNATSAGNRAVHAAAYSSHPASTSKPGTADHVNVDSNSADIINSQQIVSLLKQLREVVVANRQSEIIDLLNDICDVARTPATNRPTSTGKKASDVNVDVEIALQPLRSENAQLRRQLRIVKQQLREKEELVTAIQKPDESYQVLHLTMLTQHLEKQLEESRTEVESFRRRIELLGEECDRISRDKSAMLNSIARKDNDYLKNLQERAFTLNQAEQALQTARSDRTLIEQKMIQLNGERQQLLQQLQQKDAECQRSRDLVRSLHELMSRLVHDIQSSRPAVVAAVPGPAFGQLNETLNAVRQQLSQLSFATPQRQNDPGRAQRTARRSLDYGVDELPSSDRRQTSTPAHSNGALRVDEPSRHRGSSPRPSAGGMSTTVKELLTPIAERMQRQKDSESSAPPRAAQLENISSGELDSTLTQETSVKDSNERTVGMKHDSDDFDHSRWSASDYFSKYPPTRQLADENLAARYVRDCSKQNWSDETRKRAVQDDSSSSGRVLLSPGMDVEFSTMLSSVRPDDSSIRPFRARSPVSVVSDTDSVGTVASLDSISTEDDTAFRAGLAQLDANIARVQQQLRGSTSSPIVQLNLGRSYSSV